MIVDATGMTLVPKIFGISPRRSHSRYIEVLTLFGMCQPLADLAGCIQKKGTELVGFHAGLAQDVTFEVCPFEAFAKLPIHSNGFICYVQLLRYVVLSISEGSLEVKLPTIWTDEKAEVGRVREEKRREEERRSDKRKSQKTEDAGAGKGRKVGKHCVFLMICGSGGSKSRLAKAAGSEPSGQMRDLKLHAVLARSTFRSQNV